MTYPRKLTYFWATFFVFYGFSSISYAQFFALGARSAAMAGAAATFTDVWAANNNAGALGFLSQSTVALYYENRFIMPQTGTYGLHAAYVAPKLGTFALSVSRYGFRLFNRNAVGIRYARPFGKHISAGIGLNYHYIFIGNGYGHASAVSAELGVLGKVTPELSLAFHLVNPVRMNITRNQTEKLPMTIRMGIAYTWAHKVVTALELDVDPEQKPNLKFGLEYKPIPLFVIRGGFSSRPMAAAFGFGFDHKKIRLDISAAYHFVLGFSPQIGMAYPFGKEVKHLGQKRTPKTTKP